MNQQPACAKPHVAPDQIWALLTAERRIQTIQLMARLALALMPTKPAASTPCHVNPTQPAQDRA